MFFFIILPVCWIAQSTLTSNFKMKEFKSTWFVCITKSNWLKVLFTLKYSTLLYIFRSYIESRGTVQFQQQIVFHYYEVCFISLFLFISCKPLSVNTKTRTSKRYCSAFVRTDFQFYSSVSKSSTVLKRFIDKVLTVFIFV
jgi:hypothetical protein